jgi:hypothetical protein
MVFHAAMVIHAAMIFHARFGKHGIPWNSWDFKSMEYYENHGIVWVA